MMIADSSRANITGIPYFVSIMNCTFESFLEFHESDYTVMWVNDLTQSLSNRHNRYQNQHNSHDDMIQKR